MTDFLRLTKYDSCRGPMGEVFCNPEFIASVERFGEYTRVELAGGTILKVAEQPDDIVERVHFATLGDPEIKQSQVMARAVSDWCEAWRADPLAPREYDLMLYRVISTVGIDRHVGNGLAQADSKTQMRWAM